MIAILQHGKVAVFLILEQDAGQMQTVIVHLQRSRLLGALAM